MRAPWPRTPRFPDSPAWLVAALTAFAVPLVAAGPTLTNVTPPGGQRGSAVRLTLAGNGLDGKIQLRSSIPGTLTELSSSGAVRQYLLEIDSHASPGAYPLAVETTDGVTNTWLFSVSSFPETVETESQKQRRVLRNDSPASAQPIQAPAVVNGTLGEADRDHFSVSLQAGERIVFEVEARRLGSAVDPVLVVRTPEGRIAARSDDSPGIGADARIAYEAPLDGKYHVEVHDARFSKQSHNFYRLVAGPVEFAEAIFPLGWTKGEPVEVELSGGTLSKPRKVTVAGNLVALPGLQGGLPLPFLRGENPESLEPSGTGRRRLVEGRILNGRIGKPGEVDRYRLKVRAGEEWMIETQAAILGTSRLYTLLIMRDQDGTKLASAGDQPPEELLSNTSTRAETFGDPALGLRVPAGVTELELSVEDLLGRGGPGYGYRLAARRQPPDFIVRLDDTHINIPQDGSTSVAFTLDRRGYMGAVQIVGEGLPDGVLAEGGSVPAEFGGMTTQRNSRNGRVILTATPDAKPGGARVTFYGEGQTEDGRTIRRRALTFLSMNPVAGAQQRPVRLPSALGSVEAMVASSAPASIEILSSRSIRLIQGLSHTIRWAYHQREGGVQATSPVRLLNEPAVGNLRLLGAAKIKPGDANGVFEMNTTMGTPAMRCDLVLQAQVRHKGVVHSVYSRAITIDIVQGYSVGAPGAPVTVQAGAEFTLEGRFARQPEFDSEVVVEAVNLPLGVACRSQSIGNSPESYSLSCQAGENVAPGEYLVQIAPRSVLAGRGKEAVPYNIPAVETVLVVAGGDTIAAAHPK